ncbi:MAG: bifunctional aspartate kinase/homoserine dehydrogenase I, partial [Acidobacteriota bacterium]
MKVLKFGGSSVANAENIRRAAEIVIGRGENCVVVLSAMQGTTDALIETGRLAEAGDDGYFARLDDIKATHRHAVQTLLPSLTSEDADEFVDAALRELASIFEGVLRVRELSPRTLDRILSFGELVSTRIFSDVLRSSGVDNRWKDSRELIVTDSNFGSAAVDLLKTNEKILEYFGSRPTGVYVLPGFIGADLQGATTTLGRGGSDYTGAIVAAAIDADALEIWTDVSGMMTADPRFVRNARQIPRITYREAMELSHFGAKVIYPPTIQPVMAKGIPLLVKNTFAPDDEGTRIEPAASAAAEGEIIRGITSIDHIAMLSLEGSGMVGIPGFSKRLFEALAAARINVILITQSSSEHSICVAVEEKFGRSAKAAVDREFENEIAVGKIEPLRVDESRSILALVGDNMRSHTGVSGRMFLALGQNGINIEAIAQGSSERNISAVIGAADVRKAVNTLHEEFFSDGVKQVNIFIAGVGTVGSRLLEQIDQQKNYLLEQLRLNVRVVAMADSRSIMSDDDGIDLTNWRQRLLSQRTDARIPKAGLAAFAIEKNFRNSVFVDVTADGDIVKTYPDLLKKSISIVACNKVACSSDHETYARLKDLSREYNTNFFFETNVGAGLPVIGTLNDLLRSGDRIRRIEAVLSGTLNFVFNNYNGTQKFADVVRLAQSSGYTEPDPRLDLSGTDVARKILILAREAGNRLELDDIENSPFLPLKCFDGSIDDFYAELEQSEDHCRRLLDTASSAGLVLKYVAKFDAGRASVGLESVSR